MQNDKANVLQYMLLNVTTLTFTHQKLYKLLNCFYNDTSNETKLICHPLQISFKSDRNMTLLNLWKICGDFMKNKILQKCIQLLSFLHETKE